MKHGDTAALWQPHKVAQRLTVRGMNGTVDVAQRCKQYVKAAFGAKSAEYKLVVKIKFRGAK
jgi:hypothetical protein